MSFLDLFREARAETVTTSTRDGTTVKTVDSESDDAFIQALIGNSDISKKQALEIPSVNYCLDVIAGTIAGLPIRLYDKKTKTEITDDDRVYLLNGDTGDTLTHTQFWRSMIEDYYFERHGGFAYLNRRRNDIKSIHYIDGIYVTVNKNEDHIFKDYQVQVDGKFYFPHDFLKIMRGTKDGCNNESLVSRNNLALSAAYYTYKFQRKLVKKGGNKRGFLKSEKVLSEGSMTALKNAFRRLYSNDDKDDESVIVLNNGVDFKEASNTSVEMQLAENLAFNVKDMMRLFGMDFTKTSGTADQDEKEFLKAITRVLSDIEASLNRDMLLEKEKKDKYFAFDTRVLTRGDIKSRFQAYSEGIKSNVLQIDEARELEDLEPLGMKWVTLGLNQVLFDPRTGECYTPNTKEKVNLEDGSQKIDENEEGGEEDVDNGA